MIIFIVKSVSGVIWAVWNIYDKFGIEFRRLMGRCFIFPYLLLFLRIGLSTVDFAENEQ